MPNGYNFVRRIYNGHCPSEVGEQNNRCQANVEQIAKGAVKYVFLVVIVMNVWYSAFYGLLQKNREYL